MYELSKKELREVQLKSLELFVYFKEVCEKENLLFYFCGGCCIGTIRHKGFIPWDDDIDIFMPRDDYNKLIIIWKKYQKDGKYPIHRAGYDNDFGRFLFTVVTDRDTTYIKLERADLDIDQGINLDIFPLDGVPSNKFLQKKQLFWGMVYSLFCADVIPKNHGTFIKIVSKLIFYIFKKPSLKTKIWKYAEKQISKYSIKDSNYVREFCAGPKIMLNLYPRYLFDSAIYKEFEGMQMPIPIGYDKYLKIAFGDYMKLPNKELQHPHHYVEYCDMHNSYMKYNGIYYNKRK